MHKRIDPFEFLYYIGYFVKKSYLLHRQKRLPCKVISVGNITVGGTGKTPTTIALALEAKKKGLQPVILTRGYKGNAKEPILINFPLKQTIDKGSATEMSPATLGDEAFMMVEKLKDVPLVKFPDRYKGGTLAFDALKQYFHIHQIVFILDDGFQHWGLYRDIDIVLVDGINPFGNRKMLPFGVLRELPRELNRADIIVITKVKNEELFNRLRLIAPNASIFSSEYKINRIKNLTGSSISIEEINNKRLYAFCGIAQPESFKKIITSISEDFAYFNEFPDHYKYKEKDITNIKKKADKLKCDFIITTEKDMVKIKGFKSADNILYIDLEISIEQGFYEKVFSSKFSQSSPYKAPLRIKL